METFVRQLDSRYIEVLNTSSWWKQLVDIVNNNQNYNIQLRNNYLNVYYKMNSLFKIDFNSKSLLITMHYKFIPIIKIQPKGKEYINVNITDEKLLLESHIEQDRLTEDLLSNLKRIEKQIDMFHGNEKYYQSKLIEKNNTIILDAEVQSEFGRIDLIALIDNQIIAIELKRLFDDRLHKSEIDEQLLNYSKFMQQNSDEILKAYINSINIKKELGIVGVDNNTSEYLSSLKVCEKPILAIVADVPYKKQDVIDLYKNDFFERFRNTTYAIYMFGDVADFTNFSSNSKLSTNEN